MSSFFTALEIASSGMSAQRTRMNVAAMNMANAQTTRTDEGGPYRRRDVVLQAAPVDDGFRGALGDALAAPDLEATRWGVEVAEVAPSDDDPILVYDPGHPDADPRGYVAYPNVRTIEEMVNMMGAARAYEAGTTVIRTIKGMAEQTMRIGRG